MAMSVALHLSIYSPGKRRWDPLHDLWYTFALSALLHQIFSPIDFVPPTKTRRLHHLEYLLDCGGHKTMTIFFSLQQALQHPLGLYFFYLAFGWHFQHDISIEPSKPSPKIEPFPDSYQQGQGNWLISWLIGFNFIASLLIASAHNWPFRTLTWLLVPYCLSYIHVKNIEKNA